MISYDWNKFVNHMKSLIIIIAQLDIFHGNDHNYVVD
jgi:hypothetical protein